MKQLILNTNLTLNGRVYTTEALERTADEINKKAALGTNIGTIGYNDPPSSMKVELNRAAFTYENAMVEDDGLYVDINLLNTPSGNAVKLAVENLVFGPAEWVDSEEPFPEIRNFNLSYIAAVNKSEDALNINTNETAN